MSTLELKNDVLRLIVETDDAKVLEQVKLFITNILHSEKQDWWDTVSEEEKQSIKQGMADADAGKLIPHEEVRKVINAKIEQVKNK